MTWLCDLCDTQMPDTEEPWVLWQGFNGSRVELAICDRCHEDIIEAEMEGDDE